MKPNKEIQFMADVAEEIIGIRLTRETTLEQANNLFYLIMRKYGIKQGTKSGHGTLCNNYEWTLCAALFDATVTMSFAIGIASLCDAPEDLQHY